MSKTFTTIGLSAFALLTVCLGVVSGGPADAAPGPYKVAKTIKVGGDGRWDFISVDPASNRLYVPRSTHVQVIDVAEGKVIADWAGTAGVHGVALVPDKGLGFTSNGKSDNVYAFDLKTNLKVGEIATGKGPDAILYDDASGKVLVFNHKGGTITLISIGEGNQFTAAEVPVGGALEVGVVDGTGHAFVNVEDKNEIVEIDTKAAKVMNHWPIVGGAGPTGLAIDVKNGRLFSGCGENNVMAVVDAATGKTVVTVPIGKGCDGCAFDAASGNAFASCGDGTLAVVNADADGKFHVAQTLATKAGARTITLDPKSHTLYLPTAESDPADQSARPRMTPGSFQVVVIGL